VTEEPATTLVRFGRALRAEGLAVGSGRIVEFARAAALVPAADLYWAGRTTLVGTREDTSVYDRVFRAFFGAVSAAPPRRSGARPVRLGAGGGDDPSPAARGDGAVPALALASSIERLRRKSFADCSAEELDELGRLMARLRIAVPTRHSRRRKAAAAGAPDLRRTLRRSFRTGGEPVERAWRERQRQPRRLILLLDVSGSMTAYSRALVMFAHAALHADRRWEAFCFATRLTRVTRALASTGPIEALRRAAEEVVDWDGGTRIGDALGTFLDRHGHAGLARGAVVVICSDGLDVGEPALLAEQMSHLARLSHRIVWLNPLKASASYEPLARGMHAALPYVDVFSAGHSLAGLEEVSRSLGELR
jgi:uncharacterized protein with von Willebrand factor type A (vWA) domain